MHAQRKSDGATEFLYAMLGIWLGVYAFRAFVPAAVWNLSDTLPLLLKGALAIGVHLLGVAGCLLPITRRRSAGLVLAGLVGTAGVLRQLFIGHDALGSALSLMAWVLWLWWLAAFARGIGSDRTRDIAAAFAVAFVFQVGMQAAWHGLDLPMARGPVAVLTAVVVNGCFVWAASVRARTQQPMVEGSTRLFAALGGALFLELTLLANVGRLGALMDLDVVRAALVIQTGLLLGISALATKPSRRFAYAAVVLLVAATIVAPGVEGVAAAILVAAQIALIVVLGSAGRVTRSVVAPFMAGMIGLFVLVFLFYSRYEWPALWLAAAALMAISIWPVRITPPLRRAYVLWPLPGILLSAIGITGASTTRPARAHDTLRVAAYNIHQGFDAAGTPAMQRIADEIARFDADVVALQEVGRGWTFLGGADLIAYLAYRFPDYGIHFVPVNGKLWGVALMSRLPLHDEKGGAFRAPARIFRYGHAGATIRFAGSEVRVVSVHLSAGLEGDGEAARVGQADQLLEAGRGYRDVIIAGDLNASPDAPPLQRILASGYTDGGGSSLANLGTWPAQAPVERIDYVLVRGELTVTGGGVVETTASDHLPVVVEIVRQGRNGTP